MSKAATRRVFGSVDAARLESSTRQRTPLCADADRVRIHGARMPNASLSTSTSSRDPRCKHSRFCCAGVVFVQSRCACRDAVVAERLPRESLRRAGAIVAQRPYRPSSFQVPIVQKRVAVADGGLQMQSGPSSLLAWTSRASTPALRSASTAAAVAAAKLRPSAETVRRPAAPARARRGARHASSAAQHVARRSKYEAQSIWRAFA